MRPSGWYIVAPLVASISLLVAANRWENCLARAEQFLVRTVSPIHYTVDMPVYAFEQLRLFFSERIELLAENGNLQQEHIHLQAQVQKLQSLEAENQELRKLLQTVGKEKDSFSQARLIHVDADPFSQQIVLNKGK
ncbi:MAG TPA: rod shape-determining protein MreC, partial [Candidatus Berkiella sp.]|nr:rod shape-determining protein MreC [Candidatus Berkiella sp.]